MDVLIFLSTLCLITASIYSVRAMVKAFVYNGITGYFFLLPILLVFYVFPYFFDILLNVEFYNYQLVREAMRDDLTNVIYNCFISFVLFFFSVKSLDKDNKKVDYLHITRAFNYKLINFYESYFIVFWGVIFLPFFCIFLFGDLDYYSIYLTRPILYSGNIPESHSIINKLSLLSVLVCAFVINTLIYQRKKNNKVVFHIILILIFVVIAHFWIDGKRGIVAKFSLVFMALLFLSNSVKTKRLVTMIVLQVVLFISFIGYYGKNISENHFEESYQLLRVDFGRDYGVKFAIYNDLILERNILPAKFESFKFLVAAYVPRSIWSEKPYPYAVYFTNSVFGGFGENHLYGWGLTTSIFTESISNLGFWGLLFGPFFLFIILKKESKSTNPLFKLLSIAIAVLLLVTQMASFMPLVLIYLYMILRKKWA